MSINVFVASAAAGWLAVASGNGAATVVETGGVPRFAIDGKPIAATAVVPAIQPSEFLSLK